MSNNAKDIGTQPRMGHRPKIPQSKAERVVNNNNRRPNWVNSSTENMQGSFRGEGPWWPKKQARMSAEIHPDQVAPEGSQRDWKDTKVRKAPASAQDEMLTRPTPLASYSSVALKMMCQMGYKQGQGLGKDGTGIVEPVSSSQQKGRRGLGHQRKSLPSSTVVWDPSKEIIEVHEKVKWLPQCVQTSPSLAQLRSWKTLGPKKMSLEDETLFCDPEVLKNVLKSKTVLDELEPRELMRARSRSNPFESIRKMIFQNRAAMKMANMDAVFDFMFTEPKTPEGRPSLSPNEPLFFADVCAGPGGFSEYVLWRKKWRTKGFGFTLKETNNDFKLDDFLAGPPETFETHYGEGGQDGNGNIFDSENINAFAKFVLESTQGQGVHFMMADGGFDVKGQENIQEILSKRLYLCQFLLALGIVRTGGHFVCKLFDIFTPFSVGLVYLLYQCFNHVCIHKPNTSRPANSERFIICKWKRQDTKAVQEYMLEINAELEICRSDQDVTEVVSWDVLVQDQGFMAYIIQSNNQLGSWQTMALAKLNEFCFDGNLRETRQWDLKKDCLQFWKIPNEVRKRQFIKLPEEAFMDLFGNVGNIDCLTTPALELNAENVRIGLKSVFDWKVAFLASRDNERALFLGLGRSMVYQRIVSGPNRSKNWTRLNHPLKFELPQGTLFLGEIACEWQGKGKLRISTLHIIDGFFIGGEDIRQKDLRSRHEQLKLLALTVNKGSHPNLNMIRVKELHNLEALPKSPKRSETQVVKGWALPRLTFPIGESGDPLATFYCPSGVIFLRVVNDPYAVAWSKTSKRKYFCNTRTHQSFTDCPREALMPSDKAFDQMKVWLWTEDVQPYSESTGSRNKSKVHWDTLATHIQDFNHKAL